MSNSRFEVGKKYPFIGHVYENANKDTMMTYSLYSDTETLKLVKTELVMLECVSEHDVPVEYREDGDKVKGYIFKREDGVELHNQYPTASYGQVSTTADHVASGIVEVNGENDLVQYILVSNALDSIAYIERKTPEQVTDLMRSTKSEMLTFLSEQGFKVNYSTLIEDFHEFKHIEIIKSNSNFSVNAENVSDTEIKIVWVVGNSDQTLTRWFHTKKGALDIVMIDEGIKDGYVFPYAVSMETNDTEIQKETKAFYQQADTENYRDLDFVTVIG